MTLTHLFELFFFFLSCHLCIVLASFRPLLPSLCFVTSIFSSSLPFSVSSFTLCTLCLLYVPNQFSPASFHHFSRVLVSFIPVPSCSLFFYYLFCCLQHLLSASLFLCLCISLRIFLVSESSLTPFCLSIFVQTDRVPTVDGLCSKKDVLINS